MSDLSIMGCSPVGLCLTAVMYTGTDGGGMGKGRAIAAAMAGAMDGESTKLTDDAVVLLEQQYGPLDRNLPTGGSFGELSLADAKLARRNATIVAAEPASLIRIDKQLYRKTLYEMQVRLVRSASAGYAERHIICSNTWALSSGSMQCLDQTSALR